MLLSSFFFFEETILSTSVWQRMTKRQRLPLSRVISDLVQDEYLRLYNSPSSRMLFPEKAVQVLPRSTATTLTCAVAFTS